MAFVILECDEATATQIELSGAYGTLLIVDKGFLEAEPNTIYEVSAVKKVDDLPEEFQP